MGDIMRKIGVSFVVILMFIVALNLQAMVIVTGIVCYSINFSDDQGSSTGDKWVCEIEFYSFGGNGDSDDNNGNEDNDDEITGPGGPNVDHTNGQKMDECWKHLTASERITSNFGVERSNSCNFHTGLDIGTAQEGGELTLFSASSGTVSDIAYQNPGAGFYIKIKNDNGSYTVYSHLDGNEDTGEFNNTADIQEGDTIMVGQTLGTTDNSGSSSASHLDIKIYFYGNRSLSYVKSKFVNNSITSSDLKYCSTKNITYINPTSVLGGKNCN